MEYKTKQQLADEMVEAWEKLWKASEEFENALEDFQGSGVRDVSNQRILQMKSKLYADRCDIEFSLNRLIEDEQVNVRD